MSGILRALSRRHEKYTCLLKLCEVAQGYLDYIEVLACRSSPSTALVDLSAQSASMIYGPDRPTLPSIAFALTATPTEKRSPGRNSAAGGKGVG